MPYLRALMIVACVVVLPACVDTKTVPLGESDSSLASKSIILAKHPVPDFTLMTRGSSVGMMFGAIGGAAAGAAGGSSGNKIVADNQIADPAVSLGDILLKEIVAKYHLSLGRGARDGGCHTEARRDRQALPWERFGSRCGNPILGSRPLPDNLLSLCRQLHRQSQRDRHEVRTSHRGGILCQVTREGHGPYEL